MRIPFSTKTVASRIAFGVLCTCATSVSATPGLLPLRPAAVPMSMSPSSPALQLPLRFATDASGALRADAGRYAVRFDDNTLKFDGGGASLSYRFEGAFVDGVALSRGERSWTKRVTDNQLSFNHSDALTERYDLLSEGVEQLFVIHRRLNLEGRDLELRGTIETALRAADPAPAAGEPMILVEGDKPLVRIGRVKAHDAAGAECLGRLRMNGNILSIVVDGAWLEAATYPVVVDPLIGAIFQIDTAVYGPTNAVGVAYNALDDVYLVVQTQAGEFSHLRATIVTGDGAVRSTQVIGGDLLAPGDVNPRNVAVAFAPGVRRWLVVWEADIGGDTDIFGVVVRYSGTGVVLDTGRQISADADDQKDPDVACNSTSCLVVWSDETNGSTFNHLIEGAHVSASSSDVLSTLNIAATAADETRPAVAFGAASSQYMVVWEEAPSTIRARVIPADSVPVEASCVVTTSTTLGFFNTDPDVAHSTVGGDYLVVWSQFALDHTLIRGEVMGSTCNTLVNDFPVFSDSDDARTPRVAGGSLDGCFAVATLDEVAGTTPYEVEIRRVCPDGAVSDPTTIAAADVSSSHAFLDIAFKSDSKDQYLVVWPEDTDGHIYGQRYRTPGSGRLSGSLRMAKSDHGNIRLELDRLVSCLPTDTDVAIYVGSMELSDDPMPFSSHVPLLCSTGGANVTIPVDDPHWGTQSVYYLAIPWHPDENLEGSYGVNSAGLERPQSASACRPQSIADCP